jgi:hypothetical protein
MPFHHVIVGHGLNDCSSLIGRVFMKQIKKAAQNLRNQNSSSLDQY